MGEVLQTPDNLLNNPYKGAFEPTTHETATPSHPRFNTIIGTEVEVDPIDIITTINNRTKTNRFVIKRTRIPHSEWSSALESIITFERLKQINTQQAPGKHRFNLPVTYRALKESDGSLSIVTTDETKGGKVILVDLNNPQNYNFDQTTYKLIKNQILSDYELAANNRICLSTSEFHPLDTWYLTYNPETNTSKVIIRDIGKWVQLNAGAMTISINRRCVENALNEDFYIGTSPFKINYKPNP